MTEWAVSIPAPSEWVVEVTARLEELLPVLTGFGVDTVSTVMLARLLDRPDLFDATAEAIKAKRLQVGAAW